MVDHFLDGLSAEQQQELDGARAETEAWSESLAGTEHRLDERLARAGERDRALADEAARLERLRDELTRRQAEVTTRSRALDRSDSRLAGRERELADQRASVDERDGSLQQEAARLEEVRVGLALGEAELAERLREVDLAESRLAETADELEASYGVDTRVLVADLTDRSRRDPREGGGHPPLSRQG